MAQRITNLQKVLDPWLEAEQDRARRSAVIETLMWASDNIETLEREHAPVGCHPLMRIIEIPEAGLLLRGLVTSPMVGFHLLRIEELPEDGSG